MTPAQPKLRINELYGPVLQGEGVSVGVPANFVRVAGCNLHCRWCDTFYTWNYEGTTFDTPHDYGSKVKIADEVHEMTVEQVVEWAQAQRVKRIIFSGGEPLVQQKALAKVMETLNPVLDHNDYRFEVETNGTVLPSIETAVLVNQFNVSPKLANSGNKEILRRRVEVLKWFAESPKAFFKFVVKSREDMSEILQLIEEVSIPKEKIILMPLGHTKEEQEKNKKTVYELCLEFGFRYSPRLHVEMYDNSRAV